ncbi:MAG: D-alanyl-D-alanine carboxypeptidase [Acidimicrobiia bacterium]|nr:D-alanyl-D-alanine carboxypeptidase [Acidimicrobiia bacterium]
MPTACPAPSPLPAIRSAGLDRCPAGGRRGDRRGRRRRCHRRPAVRALGHRRRTDQPHRHQRQPARRADPADRRGPGGEAYDHPRDPGVHGHQRGPDGGGGGHTDISLAPAETNLEGDPVGTELVASGTIAADADPLLNVYQVPDPPRYARTLFIEALERAGVTVTADPTAPNSTDGLPGFDSYGDDTEVASITSPELSAIATLIWKISHNYGANLAVCLLAVEQGSTDCPDGLGPVHDRMDQLDLSNNEVWALNGAGAGFSSTTPTAMVTWIRWMHGRDWGGQLPEMLPIMGTDGSLSLSQTDTPSTGKVQAKTGTWAAGDPATGALLMPTQGLGGFMEDTDGDQYLFAVYVNDATFSDPGEIITALDNVAAVAAAIQQSL